MAALDEFKTILGTFAAGHNSRLGFAMPRESVTYECRLDSRSIDGADLAATMCTTIESCKTFELDPRNYFLETLKLSAAKEDVLLSRIQFII